MSAMTTASTISTTNSTVAVYTIYAAPTIQLHMHHSVSLPCPSRLPRLLSKMKQQIKKTFYALGEAKICYGHVCEVLELRCVL